MSVPPYSTIDLPVDPASAQLPQSLSYCSFRIQYSGQPGSVVAALSSVEERSNFVVDSRVVNERVITMSGANPWHLDTDTESVLFLTSTSDKEGGVALQICASGVKYHITDMRLKPHETRAINIRKLRDQQKPDFLNNKIPADATDGAVFWLDVGEKPVVGRLVVFHPSGRTASNYDCGCECGDQPGGGAGNLEFDSYSMAGYTSSLVAGQTEDLQAIAQYDDCNGNYYYYALADSWTASPSLVGGVASQSGGSIGHVTTQSPGQLNITAQYSYCEWTYDPASLLCDCGYVNEAYAYATINVLTPPTITLSSPLWFFGSGIPTPPNFTDGSTNATLTASGAGNGTFTWTITNGSSKATFENNSSTITKTNVNTVGISSTSFSTAADDVTIQLQWTPPGGSQFTLDYSLSIDSPYKLTSGGSITSTGVMLNTCPNPQAGTAGYISYVPYLIQSFFGVQISNIGVNEAFGGRTEVYQGNNWPSPTPVPYTSPDGSFSDHICQTQPSGTPPSFAPGSPESQLVFQIAQNIYAGSLTSGSGLIVQEDVLEYYQTHGDHTGILSPVR